MAKAWRSERIIESIIFLRKGKTQIKVRTINCRSIKWFIVQIAKVTIRNREIEIWIIRLSEVSEWIVRLTNLRFTESKRKRERTASRRYGQNEIRNGTESCQGIKVNADYAGKDQTRFRRID